MKKILLENLKISLNRRLCILTLVFSFVTVPVQKLSVQFYKKYLIKGIYDFMKKTVVFFVMLSFNGTKN
jgi:hypothetical protein